MTPQWPSESWVHERSLGDPGDDLGFAVWVGVETVAGRHALVVIHQQSPGKWVLSGS